MKNHHQYTHKILDAFAQISQVPRPSKREEKIVAWLMNWASENGLEARTDEAMNVLIEVPASSGYENSQTLVLQGHMDMVCEKAKGFSHDFDNDPIELIFTDDGWLTANQTTLGADNGIAIAMAMVAATDDKVGHPPLELLFTHRRGKRTYGGHIAPTRFYQGQTGTEYRVRGRGWLHGRLRRRRRCTSASSVRFG